MGFPCLEVVTCQKDVFDVRGPRLGTWKEGTGAQSHPHGNPRFSEQLVENLYSKWLSGGLPVTNAAPRTCDE